MNYFQPGQQAYIQGGGTSTTTNLVIMLRDPLTNDVNYPVGIFWINTQGQSLWYLNSFSSFGGYVQALWLQVQEVAGTLETLTGNSGGAVSPSLQNINIVGDGTTATVVGNPGTNTLTISSIGSGAFTWTNKNISFAAAAANGYFITNTATATLPASPSLGDTIEFIVDTTAILTIQAVGSQKIRIANSLSSTAGTAVNSLQGDSLTLIYSDTTTSWVALDLNGSWQLT